MLKIENVKISDITPYKHNAKQHPAEQIKQIAASIRQFGMNDPLAIDEENVIIEGHGRLLAIQKMQAAGEYTEATVPCIRLTHLTDQQKKAYILAHNKLTMNSGFDLDILSDELERITEFDMADFGFIDEENEKERDAQEADLAKRRLTDFFLVPPFSVLDARSGYWQDRKADWNRIIGNASATRDSKSQQTYRIPEYMPQINDQTSNFDPVLAETMMRWFNRPGGKILDPFGGEQTKGVVAGELGFQYYACEIRQDQVDLNNEKTARYSNIHYFCGDSNDISNIIHERNFDMCFTSPPYYDLEVYSKEDMSALGTYEEFMVQYKNIFEQCYEMLAEDAFLVLKVGEIRDKKTGVYRSFVPDNIKLMTEIGFKYYNELIFVTVAGSAPMRAYNSMKSRKVAKTHQNVIAFYKGNPERVHEQILAFYKGDPRQIPALFPTLNENEIIMSTTASAEEVQP